MMKRTIWAACCLLAFTVTSCGTTSVGMDSTAAGDTGTDSVQTVRREWWEDIGSFDLKGATIHVLSRNMTSWVQAIREMGPEESTGDVLDDAFIARNRMVEERYNVKLDVTYDVNAHSTLKNSILAGDDIADIAFISLDNLSSYGNNGLLQNLNELPYLNFSRDYWDANAYKSLNFGGRLDYMCGKLTVMCGQGTWAVMFNKKMAEDYKLGDFYEVVNGNHWTFDKMYSLAKVTAKDIDGNGEINELDQYGLILQEGDVQMMYFAAGEHFTETDESGTPVMTIGATSRSSDVFDKISAIFADSATCLVSNRFASKYSDAHTVAIQIPCFESGRSLFWMSGVLRLYNMRESYLDFGILPMPKYEESQDNYCHMVKENWGSGVAIPKSCQNTDNAALILEALAAASADTVHPAYYETTLGVKLMRDEQSYEMLDIIMSSLEYDPLCYYKWGNIVSTLNSVGANNSGTFKSTVDSQRDTINAAIASCMEQR